MQPDTPSYTVVYCRCGKVSHQSRRVATENLNQQKRHLRYNGREKLGTLIVFYCVHSMTWHCGNNYQNITKRMKANKRRPKYTGGDYDE